eukprot:TRINITY_DN20992_c0_g1_i1.p1 TRINITY_DN20992_c0_g1~~TRINITY_DN20992_c0_g1_i1.p1  ORF type:complete len:192 (+),score=50.07 TRINITY_DN20992_c0_g1_i1:44-619(+)
MVGYDSEGNPIETVGDQPPKAKRKAKGKSKTKRQKIVADDSSDEEEVVNPFAMGVSSVIDKEPDVDEMGEIEVFDNDIAADAATQKQMITESKKAAAKEAELAAYRRRTAKQEQADAANRRHAMKKNKNSCNPMGHYSNPASDNNGIISDGIYFWTNMGVGKMPLKVKKQWQGKSDVDPKRARQMGYLPRE